MQEIWFSNSINPFDSQDRMCCVPDDNMSGWAVFDALCKRFGHVEWYDVNGELVRKYLNIY